MWTHKNKKGDPVQRIMRRTSSRQQRRVAVPSDKARFQSKGNTEFGLHGRECRRRPRDRSRGDGRRRACVPELGDGGAGPEVVLNGLGADDPAGGAVLGLVHQLRRVVPVLRFDLRRAVPHVRALDAEALDEHLGLSVSLSTERRNGESWLDS
jgi:hypothetical protein